MPVYVAPVRERGLKSLSVHEVVPVSYGRSREGAWIEINYSPHIIKNGPCRSREGAWIEIKMELRELAREMSLP